MRCVYRVLVIESERGWGQKESFKRDFDSKDEADRFVAKFNAKNNKDFVPEWYEVALTPQLVDLDEEART